MVSLPRWLIGDAVALDELGNAVFLDGNPHETISAHCGAQIVASKQNPEKFAVCRVCKFVFWFTEKFFSVGHCVNSYLAEKALIADSAKLNGVNSNNPSGV